MTWQNIVKGGFGLKQFQKELIDEIMSDEKPRTAREIIEDWFDLIAARKKENKTLSGGNERTRPHPKIEGVRMKRTPKDRHLTNNSVAPYKEVRYYLESSLEYMQVGQDEMGRHRYKSGGQDDLV